MPDSAHQQIILGFDFGMRRIGVAVGQTLTQSANPITILTARDGIPNWQHIAELLTTWQAEAIVVGIPINMDGSEQELTHAARKFARRCQARFNLPVHTVDERLTTIEAKWHHRSPHNKSKRLPPRLDSYCAKLILEQWLRQG